MARSAIKATTTHVEGTLDFDDDTLRAIAEVYKNEGNDEYRRKEFSNAVYFYTEGIKVNCKDNELTAKLYSNRATGHFYLGNFHDTLNDAKAAIELQPTYIKAIERGARACMELHLYKEAITFCDKGLAINKNNKTLVDLRTWTLNKTLKEEGDGAAEESCSLGVAHEILGKIKNPIDYLQEIAKELSGDRIGEARAYSNLGIALYGLGHFRMAIQSHECHLKIAKELGDRNEEGDAYGNLGNAHHKLGDFNTGMYYYELQLKISKEVGDRAAEGSTYGNIGVAYESLGDFKTAKEYHELDLKISREVGNISKEGRACRNFGRCYYKLADFKQAIHFYELGLKIAKEVGDRAGEGNAYCEIGVVYHTLGDFKTAIDYHELHLKVAKGVGSRDGERHAYGNLGNVYRSLGDYRKAIHFHELGLKIAKEVGNRAEEGYSYCNLGSVYCSLGDFMKGKDYYELHLNIAIEVGDTAGVGSGYGNLGIAYRNLGDFKKAIDYHELHLKISKELEDRVGEGCTYGLLGNAYHSLGDFKKAIDYYKLHLEISNELGDLPGEQGACGNLGNAYKSLSDFENAIHYLELSLKLAKQMGAKNEEAKTYGNLGIIYDSLGDVEKAIEYHERHLKVAKEVGDRTTEGNAYGNLGNAYYRLGDFQKVIHYKELHLKIAKEVGDRAGEAKTLYGLGCTFGTQGVLNKAVDCFQASVKILNDIRDHLQLKDEWKINLRHLYQYVYTSLWRALLKQGKVVEALVAAEQGRAQALKDLMEVKYGHEAADGGLRTLEECIGDTLSFMSSNTIFIAVNEEEIVFWVGEKGKDVKLKRHEIIDKSPLDDVTTFLQSIRQDAYNEIGVRDDVKCEDRSLEKLTDDEVTTDRSDEQTGSSSVHLKPTSLRRLYDSIIAPISDLIHGHELIFLPDGPLCLVPFAAFVDSNSKYLSESFRIRVIPSLASLKLIADCPDGYHSTAGALLVGDPWVQDVRYEGRRLQQLPCAREEVEMIGRILKTAPLTGTEATKDAVLQRLSSVALIHIAAHGRMKTGEIALAPNPTRASRNRPKEDDYLLTMRDVLGVQIRARLVVLSCCHSARGEIKAEGVVGIARAFLGAGARSVLVSLWAINDEATMKFMKMFYQHLAEGTSASEALNRAMNSMRESKEPIKHWAPFVLIGDDVTMEFGASD